jgi:hypothetical protein
MKWKIIDSHVLGESGESGTEHRYTHTNYYALYRLIVSLPYHLQLERE